MDEEPRPGSGVSQPSTDNSDKSVVGKWELLYQINDKGERQNPKDQTKTQIEFTDNGQVVFNRFDNENSDSVKSRTGKYSIEKGQISITDDAGNTVKWPFQVTQDSLIISMPEVNKKFHWRRIR
ncbi:MAG: lipocalin family protein [Desulfomonilaceae bacterium]